MMVHMQDSGAYSALSPAALAAYAKSLGWEKAEEFGDHSDVYVASGRPEVILPRTQDLGDYATVVSQLIAIFAKASNLDESLLYRHLATLDRDAVRFRVIDPAGDGSIPLSAAVNLMSGAQELMLAAACSFFEPRPVYRAGANRDANNYLDAIRFGQTEQGSFVMTMLSPIVPPRLQLALSDDMEPADLPLARKMTLQLQSSLDAVRAATEEIVSGSRDALKAAVEAGVSANLCEAIARVSESFSAFDTTISWALTRPVESIQSTFRFAAPDAAILKEAARELRSREPRPDVSMFGFVERLKRDQDELDGTVTIKTSLEGKNQSVTAVLDQHTYDQAVQAHRNRSGIVIQGDLETVGQRWRLFSGRILDIIAMDESEEDEEEN